MSRIEVTPGVEPFGDRAVLVTCAGMTERIRVAAELRERLPGLLVRSGMRTVLVEQPEPDPALPERVTSALAAAKAATRVELGRTSSIVIPVAYEGQDLVEVSALLGLTVVDLVAAHVAQTWRVAMMGFAPGFGYLVPDGPQQAEWSAVPRRATPRAAVPAGSVAVSAGMSAVYPAAMPGGWHLIGRTDVRLFDPGNPGRPTLLDEGVVVRFVDGSSS